MGNLQSKDLIHDANTVQKESPLAAPKTAHSFFTKPSGQNHLFWPHPLQNTKVNESEESFQHFSKSQTSQEEHIVPFSLTAGYNLRSMLIESSNLYKETLSIPEQPMRNHTFSYTSPGDILPTVEHSEKHVITSNFTTPGDFLPNSGHKEKLDCNNELNSTIRSKYEIYFLEDEVNCKEGLENLKKEDKANETPQRKHVYTEPCMMHNSENGSPQAPLDPSTQQYKPTDNIAEVSDETNTSSKEEEVEHKPSVEVDSETKKSPYSKPQIPRGPETFGTGLGGGHRFTRRDPYQSPRSAYYHKKELENSRASYARFERYANRRGARSSGGQRGGHYDGPGGGPYSRQRGGPYDGPGGGSYGGPRGGSFDGSAGGPYDGPRGGSPGGSRGGPPGGSRGGPPGGSRGGPPFSAGNGEENWGRSRYIEPPPSAVVVRLDKYGYEVKKNEDGTITLTEPTPEYKTFSLGIEGKILTRPPKKHEMDEYFKNLEEIEKNPPPELTEEEKEFAFLYDSEAEEAEPCRYEWKDFEDIPKARYGRETRVHRTYVKFSTFIEGPSLEEEWEKRFASSDSVKVKKDSTTPELISETKESEKASPDFAEVTKDSITPEIRSETMEMEKGSPNLDEVTKGSSISELISETINDVMPPAGGNIKLDDADSIFEQTLEMKECNEIKVFPEQPMTSSGEENPKLESVVDNLKISEGVEEFEGTLNKENIGKKEVLVITDEYLEEKFQALQPALPPEEEDEMLDVDDEYDDGLYVNYGDYENANSETEEEYDDDCSSKAYFYERESSDVSISEDDSVHKEMKSDYPVRYKDELFKNVDDYSDNVSSEEEYNDGKSISERNLDIKMGYEVYKTKKIMNNFDYESDVTYYDTDDEYDSEAVIEESDNYEDEQSKSDSYDDDVPYNCPDNNQQQEESDVDVDKLLAEQGIKSKKQFIVGTDSWDDYAGHEEEEDEDDEFNIDAENRGKRFEMFVQDWDPEECARENEDEDVDKEYEYEEEKYVELPYEPPVDPVEKEVIFGKELLPLYFYKHDSEPETFTRIRGKLFETFDSLFGIYSPFKKPPPKPLWEDRSLDLVIPGTKLPEGFFEGCREPDPEDYSDEDQEVEEVREEVIVEGEEGGERTEEVTQEIEYEYEYEYENDPSDETEENPEFNRLWNEAGNDNDLTSSTRRWRSWRTEPSGGSQPGKSSSFLWNPKEEEEDYDSDYVENKGNKWKKNDQWQHYRDWLLRQGTQMQSPQSREPQSKPKSGADKQRSDHWQHYQSWLAKQQSAGGVRRLDTITSNPAPSKPTMPSSTYDSRFHWQHYQNWQKTENKDDTSNTSTQRSFVFQKPDEYIGPGGDKKKGLDKIKEKTPTGNTENSARTPSNPTQNKTKDDLIDHWDSWLLQVAEDKKGSVDFEKQSSRQSNNKIEPVDLTKDSNLNPSNSSSRVGFTGPYNFNKPFIKPNFSKLNNIDPSLTPNKPLSPQLSYKLSSSTNPYFELNSNFIPQSSFNNSPEPIKVYQYPNKSSVLNFKPLTELQSNTISKQKTYGFIRNSTMKTPIMQGPSNIHQNSSETSVFQNNQSTEKVKAKYSSSGGSSGGPPDDSDHRVLMENLVEHWLNWLLQLTKRTKFLDDFSDSDNNTVTSEKSYKRRHNELIQQWNRFASVLPESVGTEKLIWPVLDEVNITDGHVVENSELHSLSKPDSQSNESILESKAPQDFDSKQADTKSEETTMEINAKPKIKNTERSNTDKNIYSESTVPLETNTPNDDAQETTLNNANVKKRKYTKRTKVTNTNSIPLESSDTVTHNNIDKSKISDKEATSELKVDNTLETTMPNDEAQIATLSNGTVKKRKYTRRPKATDTKTTLVESHDTVTQNNIEQNKLITLKTVNKSEEQQDVVSASSTNINGNQESSDDILKEVTKETEYSNVSVDSASLPIHNMNTLAYQFEKNIGEQKQGVINGLDNSEFSNNSESGSYVIADENINIVSPDVSKKITTSSSLETPNLVTEQTSLSSSVIVDESNSSNTTSNINIISPTSESNDNCPSETQKEAEKKPSQLYRYQEWLAKTKKKPPPSNTMKEETTSPPIAHPPLSSHTSQHSQLYSKKKIGTVTGKPKSAVPAIPPWKRGSESKVVNKKQEFGDHVQQYKSWLEKVGIPKTIYTSLATPPETINPIAVTSMKTTSLAQKTIKPPEESSEPPSDEKIQYLHQRWLVWQQKLASKMVDKINRRLRYQENPTLHQSPTNTDDMKVKDMIKQRDYWREIQRWATRKTFLMYNKTPPQYEDLKAPEGEIRRDPKSWPGKEGSVVDFPQSQRMNPVRPRSFQWTTPNPHVLQTTQPDYQDHEDLEQEVEKTDLEAVVPKPEEQFEVQIPASKAAVRRATPVKPAEEDKDDTGGDRDKELLARELSEQLGSEIEFYKKRPKKTKAQKESERKEKIMKKKAKKLRSTEKELTSYYMKVRSEKGEYY